MDNDYRYKVEATEAALRHLAKEYPLLPGLIYTSGYDFLVQHGRANRPGPWEWWRYSEGRPKNCYGNAIVASVIYGLRYIEGVALAPTGYVISHAWNEDRSGELVDTTWRNSGMVYIGVEFSVERADDATWNGDGCILNDENRNYPVFQQRWTGENYALEWPYSDRLEALRDPNGTLPLSMQAYLRIKEERSTDAHNSETVPMP